ncbi:hypothetical protein CCACVL1_14874, partial [Corchorus capsularis]
GNKKRQLAKNAHYEMSPPPPLSSTRVSSP